MSGRSGKPMKYNCCWKCALKHIWGKRAKTTKRLYYKWLRRMGKKITEESYESN